MAGDSDGSVPRAQECAVDRWTQTWVYGREGRGPRWFEVVLWVAILGGANVGLLLSLDTDLPGRVFLVVASVAGWTWFLTGASRRSRRR